MTESKLLNGQVLKRLDFESKDSSVTDSGHALFVAVTDKQDTLVNATGAGACGILVQNGSDASNSFPERFEHTDKLGCH